MLSAHLQTTSKHWFIAGLILHLFHFIWMFFPDRTSIFRGLLRSPGEGEKVGEFPRSAGGGAVATTIGSCLDLFFFRGRCLVVATIRWSSSGILLVVWRWLWVKFGSLNFSTGMIQLTLAEHEPELDGLVTLKERNRQIVFKVNHELKQKNAWCHSLLY